MKTLTIAIAWDDLGGNDPEVAMTCSLWIAKAAHFRTLIFESATQRGSAPPTGGRTDEQRHPASPEHDAPAATPLAAQGAPPASADDRRHRDRRGRPDPHRLV